MGCGASSRASFDTGDVHEEGQGSAGEVSEALHEPGFARRHRDDALSRLKNLAHHQDEDTTQVQRGSTPNAPESGKIASKLNQSSLANLMTQEAQIEATKYWGTLRTLQESPNPSGTALKLYEEHGRFLVNFVALLDRHPHRTTKRVREHMRLLEKHTTKPQLESREFPPHTMDNLRMRRMCDELLTLENPTFRSYSYEELQKDDMWMRDLRVGIGTYINSLRLTDNPSVTTGGYFILAQMLSYVQALVSLDLSSANLNATDAHVLAFGLAKNRSLQELRIHHNRIADQGATAFADVLRSNSSLLLMDMRSNKIRGLGICVLTDAMKCNRSVTELDLRWNFSGEKADYVEQAVLDLERFCFRNLAAALDALSQDIREEQSERTMATLCEASAGVGGGGAVHAADETEARASDKAAASSGQSPQQSARDSIHSVHSANNKQDADRREGKGPSFRMHVTIRQAQNLPQVLWNAGTAHEFMGMPRAYCVFSLNSRKIKTATWNPEWESKGWNPAWESKFTLEFQEPWQVCRLQVKNAILGDDRSGDGLLSKIKRGATFKSSAPIATRAGRDGPGSTGPGAVGQDDRSKLAMKNRAFSRRFPFFANGAESKLGNGHAGQPPKQQGAVAVEPAPDDFTIGEWKIPVGQILNWKGVSKDVNDDGSTSYCSYYRHASAAQGDEYTICKGIAAQHDISEMQVGDFVEAKSKDSGRWYPAIIKNCSRKGEVDIEWEQHTPDIATVMRLKHTYNSEQHRGHDTRKNMSEIKTGRFASAEGAARAFDDAQKLDHSCQHISGAVLNYAGDAPSLGLHVMDKWTELSGDDGSSVIGVQAGVATRVHLALKITDPRLNYFEIMLVCGKKLPKMDAGLGTCDAYCRVLLVSGDPHGGGERTDYVFTSKVVKNSLDPTFEQEFRISIPQERLRQIRKSLTCKVEVWDWDRASDDDLIGVAQLELMPFIAAAHHDLEMGSTPGASLPYFQQALKQGDHARHHCQALAAFVRQGPVLKWIGGKHRHEALWRHRHLTLDRKNLKYYASKHALEAGDNCLGSSSCLHIQVQESAQTEDGCFFTVIDSDGHRMEFCVQGEDERQEWCQRIREIAGELAAAMENLDEPCALGSNYQIDGDYDIMDPDDDSKHIRGQQKALSQVALRFRYVPGLVSANEYESETDGEESEDDFSQDGVDVL